MNRDRFGCLSIVLFLVLCVSLLFNGVLLISKSGSVGQSAIGKTGPKFEEEIAVPAKAGEPGADAKIALLYLRGIITGGEAGSVQETMVEDLKLQLQQAVADDKIKAIVLYVDSPGGEVTASDTIYQAVRAARAKKNVVIYMGSLAASGGYYVACAGSHLMASETTLTGSIGVIMQSPYYKPLLDKVGVDIRTFKSGAMKDMLSGSRDITDAEREYVQKLIDQTYGKFVGIVAKERKIDEAALRKGVADGRVLSGKDALENKLIDATGTVEDAYAKAMGLGGAKGAAVIRYESPFKLGKLFKILGQSEHGRSKVEIKLTEGLLPKLEAGHLYFLPGFLAP